jgi:hypothetical protein
LFDVGLYVGTIAPAFVVPDYATEMLVCQRYVEIGQEPVSFEAVIASGITYVITEVQFRTIKRSPPGISFFGSWTYLNTAGTGGFVFTPTVGSANIYWFSFLNNALTNWAGWGGSSGTWLANSRLS